MFNWFLSLDLNMRVQIISIITTCIISIISIVIALATLIQTNKINKDANRPYIVISIDFIHVSSSRNKYIIIKNFGKTAGKIKSLSTSRDIDFCGGLNPFSNLTNVMLAPNQSIVTACDFKSNSESILFNITYSDSRKSYTENFNIIPTFSSEIITKKNSASNYSNTENLLVHITEEIIRSQF